MFRSFSTVACLVASQVLLADSLTLPRTTTSNNTGCGKHLPKGQTTGGVYNVSIESDAIDRSYLVFIPPTYDPSTPTPLILSYHGGLRTALSQLELDELTNPYFNNVSMIIYPQGIDEKWQGVPGITTNDTLFTSDILNSVQTKYCIDKTSISCTGKSDGAGFCNVLACDATLSSRFAAFAPVSGAYYVDTLPCYPNNVSIPCSPNRKNVPFLTFHGGNDTTIAYTGGERKDECLPSIPHFIQSWAARNHLSENNLTESPREDVVNYSFGEGYKVGEVGLWFEKDIGHDWPSTVPNADNEVAGHHVAKYNATPIILEFFKHHRLGM